MNYRQNAYASNAHTFRSFVRRNPEELQPASEQDRSEPAPKSSGGMSKTTLGLITVGVVGALYATMLMDSE